jgi:hypothetical protein
MVLDTKKGLLKADKEKGQYVDSEKGNSKEKRKRFFFDVTLTLEHRTGLRFSAKASDPIFFLFFFTLFFCWIKIA